MTIFEGCDFSDFLSLKPHPDKEIFLRKKRNSKGKRRADTTG
jgi:hypothetical protein